MKKNVPKLPQLTVPTLLCCLAAQPLLAASRPAELAGEATLVYFQADGPVSGRVIDEKGGALPGVNVVVKGTSNGAQTDADGRFTLTAPSNATLVVSFVGYTAQEVAVNGRTSINISLAPDTKTLNDVVVVGYLTQNREEVTGSVATVSGTDVRRAPVATLGEGIQGRLPGVQVSSSGVPGQAPNVNIRGIGSIASGGGPLYVVDGLWTTNLRDFNPQDVESVQVLKDAASLAPYGSSGANGVIVITTRRGKAGTPTINFNAYAGVQNITKTYDLLNSQDWANINNQAHDNAGVARLPFANTLPRNANGEIIDTDWQKELIKQGSVQDYNLNFSGGSKGENGSSNFLIGAGYFNQKGTIVGPKFERYSVRINSGFTRGRIRIGESLLLTRTNQTRINGLPFNDVLRMLPVIPVYDPTRSGGFGYGDTNASTFGTNPIAQQKLFNNTGTSNRLQGSIFGEVDITSFLRYRLNLGTEFHAYHDREKRQYGQWRQNDPLNPSSYAENQGNELFGLAENTLTFDRSFGDHNLTAVAGYSRQRQHNEFTRGLNNDYGTGPVYYWALSAGSTAPQVSGNEYTWTKESYFGQMTYDYDQRFLLTGAIRRDGSSRFSSNNRWGTFWAGSAGWRISKEDFFQGASDVISNLKLRTSYGAMGNDFLGGDYGGSYRSLASINPNVNYPFGSSQTIVNGQIQTQIPSLDIAWEDRRTVNAGFDAGFLQDRITVSADYYVSQTRNALVDPPIATFYGNAGNNPYQRIGRLENRGFELAVGYNENRGPFTYSVTGNLSTLKNKVTELRNVLDQQFFLIGGAADATRTEEGHEIGSFFLYQFDGIFQQGDNIAGSAQPQASPGDVRYKDVNGDGIISERDRVHVGRVLPKIQYGLNLTAAYGNFDLAAFFQGVQGNDVLNVGRWWLDRTDDNSNYRSDFNPWTPQNPSNTTPRAIIAGAPGGSPAAVSAGTNSFLNSTRWLENGSYLRLKNVQIGYTIPKALTERVKGIGSLRIYLTGQNVFTITKYKGYDPETIGSGATGTVANTLARGVDDGSFPNIRTFTAGLQLGF